MNIDHIVTAYAFTDEDKDRLVNILAKSYLLAKTQTYNQAIARTKQVVTIRNPWQPGTSDVRLAQQWATMQVDSIVETYETLLQHAIEQMPEEPQEAIGDVIGKAKDIGKKIAEWFLLFLPWKTKQIANQTWGTGANDGTNEFIEEVQESKKTGGDVSPPDNNVEGDLDSVKVRVVPAKSSSDLCKEYAGNTYSLDDEIPDFPAHPFCIHSKEVIVANKQVYRNEVLT